MPIPINPSVVANARVYPTQFSAVPLNVCKSPAEGLKCVPFQIKPNDYGGKPVLVDLTAGNPPPLSQVACIYVDCSQMSYDVTIIFADTGYEFTCPAQSSRLVPMLGSTALPKFYVSFSNYIAADALNIMALSQFIPPFSVDKDLEYVKGERGLISPKYYLNKIYANGNIQNTPTFPLFNVLVADNWFLNGLEVSAVITSTGIVDGGIQFFDGAAGIFVFPFYMGAAGTQLFKLASLTNINYISAGGGNFGCRPFGTTNVSKIEYYINMVGGVI